MEGTGFDQENKKKRGREEKIRGLQGTVPFDGCV